MYKSLQKQLNISKNTMNHSQRLTFPLCTLKQNDYFGEFSFFSELPLTYKARSKDFTTILTVKRSDMMSILEYKDIETFHEIKHHLTVSLNSHYLQKKCFKCGKSTHDTLSCDIIHYEPNKLSLILKHIYNKPQLERRKLNEVNSDQYTRRCRYKSKRSSNYI